MTSNQLLIALLLLALVAILATALLPVRDWSVTSPARDDPWWRLNNW